MSDTLTIDAPTVTDAPATVPSRVVKVPVVKGKGFVEIDIEALPDNVYKEVILQGLKVLVNRGTSKVTGSTYPKEAELRAKAMEIAKEQVANLLAGKVRATGTKTKGVSGAVMTEARRVARNMVKDELKRNGEKVSHYSASDITKAANLLIEAMPELIAQAEAALEERTKKPLPIALGLKEDPKMVARAEEAKTKKKTKPEGQLSAAQAAQTLAKAGKGKGATVGK